MTADRTDPAPTWLPTLDEAAVSHTLDVCAEAEPDFLALPARPGVAVFEDESARPLVIATTADLRELARRRLAATPAGGSGVPRADHRAVTRRILAFEVGSALEADVVYLAQARARMPGTHRTVIERWRPWFVRVEPDAEFPQWARTSLAGAGDELPAGILLGPLPDKEAAARFIELVTDAFDLCRDYSLMVQAPRARACAYKEMGRCPAPCDGTEPMPSFRLRTRRALEAVTGGLSDLRARLEADMRAAAAATAFETAAELKQQLQRLDALAGPAFAHVGDLRRWRLALVVPSPRSRHARVLVLAGGRLGIVDDIALEAVETELECTASRLLAAARQAPPLMDGPAQLDTLAAVTRWMYTSGTRRRGTPVPIDDADDPQAFANRLAAAAKPLKKARAEPVPDQAIEG